MKRRALAHALGISPHTGWAACVVVAGTPAEPVIVANQVIRYAEDAERFCYHAAAEMNRATVEQWLADVKRAAVHRARLQLAPLCARAEMCAIAAKDTDPGSLDHILAAHPRIHTAEGCFHRDVLKEACTIPVELVRPSSLDPAALGKITGPPWGRTQKIAALAAWSLLDRRHRAR
jgi:hypothetical protein